MTHARRELLPGWRAGLLVLGLYAMLMQGFLGALAGPLHPPPGPEGVLCSSSAEAPAPDEAPAAPGPHKGDDCCAALCHATGALAGAAPSPAALASVGVAPARAGADEPAFSQPPRTLPPARAPPPAGFALPV